MATVILLNMVSFHFQAINRNGASILDLPSGWRSGYWVAKRRAITNVTSPAECFASPMVWATDDIADGQFPEQSWESSTWCSGEPSSGGVGDLIQIYCALVKDQQFCFDDAAKSLPRCPVCQLDVK
jgi:hypothetical protein